MTREYKTAVILVGDPTAAHTLHMGRWVLIDYCQTFMGGSQVTKMVYPSKNVTRPHYSIEQARLAEISLLSAVTA